MICYHKKIPKKSIGDGIIFQYLGKGKQMNVFHWNIEDGSVVEMHHHPEEQFGYVIRGGFMITIDGEKYKLGPGDAYFIPPNAMHEFVAIGKTEAIDVFSPKKQVIPGDLNNINT